MVTAAADLAIDRPNVLLVIMMEWLEDIATYVQRPGHAAQCMQGALCLLVAGLSAYLVMISQTLRQLDALDATDNEDDMIVGSASHLSPTEKSRKRSSNADYGLTPTERKCLVKIN